MKKTELPHLPIALVTSDKDNDLLQVLTDCFTGVLCYPTVAAALDAIAAGADARALMLLADGYPETPTAIGEGEAARIAALGLRSYIEYPAAVPALGIDGYADTALMGYARAVVTAPEAMGLDMHSILYIHGAKYIKRNNTVGDFAVIATVAGYDTAILGLSDCEAHTLLAPMGNVLWVATKLSQFVRARYAPYQRFRAFWKGVLSWLLDTPVPQPSWTPAVTPSYGKDEPLRPDAYREAVKKNSNWYLSSGILAAADGSQGIYEGFGSGNRFDALGRQKMSRLLRADCNGESIGALALASHLLKDARYGEVALASMRWLLCESLLSGGDRADPRSAQYGLLSWHNGAYDQYYGDDNAKAILGLLLAAAALKTDEFDARILRAILANFRTTGARGFRGARLMAAELEGRGWRAFYEATPVNYSAHFEAIPWACYLWAYARTGYRPLLERTKIGIRLMMAAYERTVDPGISDKANEWRWTNGMQQERAKMILPLAWLVRIEPTTEHFSWLDRIIGDLAAYIDPQTGALADRFGDPCEGRGLYGPFTENAQYGKHESPVIQQNGDPCSDSLYTASFAMMALLEAEKAVEAMGDRERAMRYGAHRRALCDYHVRIQQKSTVHKEFDGVWFRGFDFEKWETYGSDGDAGWGIWCVETGWSQAWISATLSLSAMGSSIWEYTETTTVGAHIAAAVREMLDGGDKK